MTRIDLDPQLAERLIDGRAGTALPRGAPEVAAVLEAVRRAATESDDSRMAATVAAMRAVIDPDNGWAPSRAPARRRVPSPLPRLLAAGVAGLTVLFGGLAAAGALPAAAQKPVADLASHVGIDLPRPAGDSNENPAVAPTTTTSSTSTTLVTGDTTTTLPTGDTTVTAPACPAPSYEGPNGCITPLPIPESPTTVPPPPTTTTTQPKPPPTTTTSTTVPNGTPDGGGRPHGDTP